MPGISYRLWRCARGAHHYEMVTRYIDHPLEQFWQATVFFCPHRSSIIRKRIISSFGSDEREAFERCVEGWAVLLEQQTAECLDDGRQMQIVIDEPLEAPAGTWTWEEVEPEATWYLNPRTE